MYFRRHLGKKVDLRFPVCKDFSADFEHINFAVREGVYQVPWNEY